MKDEGTAAEIKVKDRRRVTALGRMDEAKERKQV